MCSLSFLLTSVCWCVGWEKLDSCVCVCGCDWNKSYHYVDIEYNTRWMGLQCVCDTGTLLLCERISWINSKHLYTSSSSHHQFRTRDKESLFFRFFWKIFFWWFSVPQFPHVVSDQIIFFFLISAIDHLFISLFNSVNFFRLYILELFMLCLFVMLIIHTIDWIVELFYKVVRKKLLLWTSVQFCAVLLYLCSEKKIWFTWGQMINVRELIW